MPNQRLLKRLEMFDLSQPAANAIFGLSNIMLIVGSILALAGTIGVIWSGGIRERFADERASDNEAKTASAVAESARASESNTKLKIELERERAERLRLEQKVAPRQLTPSQRSKLSVELLSSGWTTGEIIWHGTGEPEAFAKDLAEAFEHAGLSTKVHTLGPFIPSAWGLIIVITENDVSGRLATMFESAGVQFELAQTNDTLGKKYNPTLVVGTRVN